MPWTSHLRADSLPWLLEPANPAVRAAALVRLLDHSPDDPDVAEARAAAMDADPIRAILAAQDPEGWWDKPGPGYAHKYTGTVWQVMFLDQLGADPADPRVRLACAYILEHAQTAPGGFGASGSHKTDPPPPSSAIHCLNGNLLRALIGFGYLEDERVRAAIAWAAAAITGEGPITWYRSGTCGPGFACAANSWQPCAWGAVKQVFALARIPPGARTPQAERALAAGVDFLLSRDPADADYPWPEYNTKPSTSWWRLGFPAAYVTDLLQNLEALVDAGAGRDPRLARALAWLEAQQDADGRWANRYNYGGKTTVDFDRAGAPSKWVTLRACTVLRAAHG